jgi:hypothetical protein
LTEAERASVSAALDEMRRLAANHEVPFTP